MITRPKVAEEYFSSAGSIDQYNHARTGSFGLEDVFVSNDPFMCQTMGLIGFIETNAFQSYIHFTKSISHADFRRELTCQLLSFADSTPRMMRERIDPTIPIEEHMIAGYPKGVQGRCQYCRYGRERKRDVKTHWFCMLCGEEFPLCSPTTGRQCFQDHIKNGIPQKKRRSTNNN